jgi:pimeloyl-ACP methyl ester carboxylesterase
VPFAQNPNDGCRIYFEDDGGDGPPVVILNGLGDPIAASRAWGVTQAISATHRLILIDHRGHGDSDKPHDVGAYSTARRVADVVAVLDDLGIDRAHFIGASWGGRLLFGIAEYAPQRVLSLTIGGQMPYRFDPDSAGVRMVTAAFETGRSMDDFVAALGGLGTVDAEPRAWTMANDFEALAAAWQAAMMEDDIAELSKMDMPCLIYAGTNDVDFFEDARRAAAEISGAMFVPLEGLSHLEAHAHVDGILPHIRKLLKA